MERKPFTLRLNPELHDALSTLSSIEHRSMNDLASEAVSEFVVTESRLVARNLGRTLARLKEYTKQDPDFEQAIEAFADAEMRYKDPLEGTPVVSDDGIRSQLRALLDDA